MPLPRRQVVMPDPSLQPYFPHWQLSPSPTRPPPHPLPDIPISSCLLALFILGAATHMTIFQLNRRRSHKFLFSGLLFGFCMARIGALVLRIVWANRPDNTDIALAATIFVAAGVLLLFLVNLVFAQRMLRAYHPRFGWNRVLGWVWKGLFGSVVAVLIMVVTATVYGLLTTNLEAKGKTRDVQRFAGVYLAVLAFLPVVVVAGAVLWPTTPGKKKEIEKFGEGRMRSKVGLLVGTSMLLTLGAAFRAGINFVPRPATDPAWYHSKAAFYCLNFGIELMVVYGYAIARFDRRFHVPDGSSGPGHYGKGVVVVNKEEEVFGEGGEEKEEGDDLEAQKGGGLKEVGRVVHSSRGQSRSRSRGRGRGAAGEESESPTLVEAVLQDGVDGKKEGVSETFVKGEV
ncbi:hypothetical protein B0T21DRAFT_447862 [Apiosordaria backusii]|uniref:Uncharacterized protein n=1 Tax=Apiosordaria backusii TaxID=314023 RepID=A0AA40ESK5_9PEZI|nr:hypothetical protein B0T21DRAFT_447862 [Apiosordaria backusii]